MKALGIDIGGTFIKYALFDESLKIIKKWKKETIQFNKSSLFYDYLCHDISTKDIAIIGVSAPGVIDFQSQVLSKAADTVKIMFQTNVNKEIKKRLHCPTYTINDARAAGKCEYEIGNSQNTKSSAYLLIGTGVGGCFYQGGHSIEGIDHIAGELSFLPFTIKDNKPISLSHFASMTALIEIYNNSVDEAHQLKYGKDICQLYLNHDSIATIAIDQWCQNIVFALNILTICYNPEVICIGGGISEEDWFINKINQIYQTSLPKRIKHLITTRIEKCYFNNDANLLGAVIFAKEQLQNK